MLVLNSCRSNRQIEYKTIYAIPELTFPTFPEAKGNVLAYDEHFKKVEDNVTEIEYVIMPYWYYKLIVEYKVKVDEQKAKYEVFEMRLK